MMVWLGIAWGAGGLLGWIGGYAFGWLVGVKETEERWSEAVGRAEDRQCR